MSKDFERVFASTFVYLERRKAKSDLVKEASEKLIENLSVFICANISDLPVTTTSESHPESGGMRMCMTVNLISDAEYKRMQDELKELREIVRSGIPKVGVYREDEET